MPGIVSKQSKATVRAFILSLIIAGTIFTYLVIRYQPTDAGLPFITRQGERLPNIPEIRSKNNIFDKIQALQFISFVNLPIQAGMMGRENPFFEPGFFGGVETIPEGVFSEEEDGESAFSPETTEEPPVVEGYPIEENPDIGEGSK